MLRLLPLGYRQPVGEVVRATVLRPVISLRREAAASDARLSDPVRLRAERDSLAAYLVGQATLQAENNQLRSLLGLRQRLPQGFIAAEVMRVPERSFEGAFLLTAGAGEGVSVGSPIVTASGLVGMVRETDARLAMGIDWTNADFRASAMTVDGETYGIVEPRTSTLGESMLALTGTAFHTELPEGTLIVTSGRGGVYPRGVPIGRVAGTEDAEGGWRKSYLLRPLVSPAEMSHVLVLAGTRESLDDHDLALSWGIQLPAPSAVDSAALATPPSLDGGTPAAAEGAAEPAAAAVVGPAEAPATPAPRPAPARPAEPQLLGTPVVPPDTSATGAREGGG